MKKTKFNRNVQNITYKQDTCLNSGELIKLRGTLNFATEVDITSKLFINKAKASDLCKFFGQILASKNLN